jgi:allantoin racemase
MIDVPYESNTRRAGLVRVMTQEKQELIDEQGTLIEGLFPFMEVKSRCIENQPRGIYDAETERIAGPKILEVARKLEGEGVEVVIISCAADPALETVRNELGIPVIGTGSATAAVALNLGRDIGVIGIGQEVPEAMAELLGDRLVSYQRIEGVETALDLKSGDAKERVMKAARAVMAQGKVDVIALACAGLSTLDVYKPIEEELGVYTVNPVIASGIQAFYALMRHMVGGGR